MIQYDLVQRNRLPCLKEVSKTSEDCYINSVDDINNVLKEIGLGEKAEEYVYLIGLNIRNKILGVFDVAHGEFESCYFNTAQLITRLLLCGARRAILAHNHPSGDPSPSEDDIKVTEKVGNAFDICGIKLLDHVIAGENCYFSVKRRELDMS